MTLAILGALVGLALVDSTSIGTIGVPVFLTVARIPIRKQLVYLGTITLFYFALGVLVLLGVNSFLDLFGDVLESRKAYALQLVIGIGLFALSFRFDSKRRKDEPERSWLPANTSNGAMVGLALTAGLLEIATMIPYLTAIGILTQMDILAAGKIATLAGYTLVMVVPALLIIAVGALAGSWFDRILEKLEQWIRKNADEMVGWTLGIVGFLLAANAGATLFNQG